MATYLSDIIMGSGVNVDFQAILGKGAINNVVIHPNPTPPANPVEGQMYFDTTGGDKQMYYYNGTAWQAFGVGGGSVESVVGGTGITETGTATEIIINLDIPKLSPIVGNLDNADTFAVYDASATAHREITFGEIVGDINHNSLLNYVASQHVDHATLDVIAGDGLTGGGPLTADVTLDVGAGEGIAVGVDDVSLDFIGLTIDDTIVGTDTLAYHNGTGHRKATFADLTTYLDGALDFTIDLAGDSGIGSVSTSQTLNIVGTATRVATSVSGSTVTVDLTNDVTIAGDLTVSQDLTVNGTLTTVNTDNLVVEDPLIKLGNNNTADSVDLGLYWQYEATGAKYGGIYRDASDANKAITFFEANATEPTTTVTGGTLADVKFGTVRSGTWLGTTISTGKGGTGLTGYTTGDLLYASAGNTLSVRAIGSTNQVLKVVGGVPAWGSVNLSETQGTLPVNRGGTGATTLTNGGVLVGSGTSAITALAVGTNGQILVGATGADPAFRTLSGDVDSVTSVGAVTLSSTITSITSLANLTTVGIIGSGTWQGNVISETYLDASLPRKYSGDVGNGVDTAITVTHNLGTNDVVVQVWDKTTDDLVFVDVDRTNVVTSNTLTLNFATAPASNAYRVVVIG